MSEPTYTIKEILESNFRSLENRIIEFKLAIEARFSHQDARVDKQFSQLESALAEFEQSVKEIEKQVADLEKENTRFKTIWGIGATIGGGLIAFFLNRIF